MTSDSRPAKPIGRRLISVSADGARLYIGAGHCPNTGILLEVQFSDGAAACSAGTA